jgi:AbiV family abortive infection protein
MNETEVLDWLARQRPPVRRKGTLDRGEVARAMTAYFHNAQSLFDESLILYGANRKARACALCVLALEELAKIPLLADTFLRFEHGADQDAWAKYWESGGNHKKKQETILAYGQIIRRQFDGEPMFSKKHYRFYAPDNLFAYLDALKQRNLYVDIRQDGVHAPYNDPKLLDVLDFLLTFGQERADSFRSWHVTTRRSTDLLNLAGGRTPTSNWTTSYSIEEVGADILYQANSLSVSEVPDYEHFIGFMGSYKRFVSESDLRQSLLKLADNMRERVAINLPSFRARSLGVLKILLRLTISDTLFGSSFTEELRKALLEKHADRE